ncbi:phosphotransferase enzyme family protein [Rhypophila decipiens]|uniref:Phosphotransferase enzyme family protein n=1 Tax=Rhypophila decipiens TaxID=261697 RepID=A0AAN7B2M5_9PEZI|nr:phosphotransferase enzyme family protein [Rhypophila decipiens]
MDSITAWLQGELRKAGFIVDSLTILSGGNANWVFCAQIKDPLPQGVSVPQVLIKHGEAYVRSDTSFSLPTSRCEVEAETLSILGTHLASFNLPVSTNPSSPGIDITVRTPQLHYFNSQTNTQVQEYLPRGIDLKTYCLKYLSPTPESKKSECLALGEALGSWLRQLHTWTTWPCSPNDAPKLKLRDLAKKNKALQKLKNATYYQFLAHQMIEKFPDILGPHRSLFEALEIQYANELSDDNENLQVVHGDFWTGNVLLPQPETDNSTTQGASPVLTSVFVVDWEVLSLGIPQRDVGQMIAELFMLKLFKNIDAGEWIIEGFLKGYGGLKTTQQAFRTLIHIGAHLVVIGGTVSGWAVKEGDVDRVVALGRDMILHGHDQDRQWFERRAECSVLRVLFDVEN